MIRIFINKKSLLILVIVLSPISFSNEIKSISFCTEDKYKSEIEATYDIEHTYHGRIERSDASRILSCSLIPALAIYNYITHSQCDQTDILWQQLSHWFSDDNKDKVILLVGNTPLLKPRPALPEHRNNQATPLTLTLSKINMQLHHQALTIPATARFCKTSIDNIIAARYPRSPYDICP